MKKEIIFTILLIISPLWAGFNFGECSGSGTFEQHIEHYGGDKENAVTIGDIPAGIKGLHVQLKSEKDVDIRLYGENNDKIVHWPSGILNHSYEETKPYKNINITYSGYNGVAGQKGNEFIEVDGITPTDMTMKAFGFQSGFAIVNYSWTGKEGCGVESGSGTFEQDIARQAITTVGEIPKNISNLEVKLISDNDIDIQLYGEDGIAIVKWPHGLMSGANKQSIVYHGMTIEWSGYNGDGTGKGHEYIKVTPKTTEKLTMKVYGYQAGTASVEYSWGNNKVSVGDWTRTNPGAGGAINMIGATASGVLVTASDLSGVYISLDKNGTHWDALGEKNGLMLTTHMSALGFHPTDGNTFYVGTGRGVYMTNNLGQHFDFISSNIPENNNNNTYVESIVATKLINDPSNTVVYVTYHDWDVDSASKIAKTINNGQTWIDVSFPDNLRPDKLRIVKLLVHPQNSNLIYAITGKPRWGCSAPKAYRSEDGGATWHDISNGHDILDLDIDYSNQNILYISTFKAVSCEYVYHDGDADEYQRGEALFDSNGYAIDGKLYKSTNKGDNFGVPIISNQTGIISVGTGHVNNSNNIKLVNLLTFSSAYWMEHDESGTWESNDYGLTWNHVASVTDWKHIGYSDSPYNAYTPSYNGYNKTLTKDLFNSDRLYFAGGWPLATFDGGEIFKSISTKQIDENKDTWQSTGIENINGYVLDVNDNNENVIYMGGYDIGFWVSKDRGLSWKWQNPFKNNLSMQDMYSWGATNHEPEPWEPSSLKTIGGTNVMTLLSDPLHANVVWSSFARAQSFADEDKGVNARSGLFRSTNYGDTWTLSTIYKKDGTLLNVNYHAVIYGLSVDKSSPVGMRTLYVTIDGDVAKSIDDGKTWHIIHEDGGLKFTAVNNGVLYAGGKSGLWRLKNNVWTAMGGAFKVEMRGVGSPMIADITPQKNITHYDEDWNEVIDMYAWNGVHDIKIDLEDVNIVYVVVYGQDEQNNSKGLYKTTDGGNSWSRIDLGEFENRYLRAIAIDPTNHNRIFLTSSENINSGGHGGSSKGIIYSTDGGATWKDATNNMAWKFGATIEIDKLSERVWAWSPGTGVQYAEIIK